MIPSVVDAPRCVKLVAPAKREYLLHRPSFLPVGWKFTDRVVEQGRTLSPVVECELDCVTSRAIRGMAGLVKRNMVKLVIDNAVVIRAPLDAIRMPFPSNIVGSKLPSMGPLAPRIGPTNPVDL